MLTEAQQEMRRTGVGSSEIGILAGLSPYGSPLEVYLSKTHPGWTLTRTPAMRRGDLLEPVIASIYAEETGAALREVGTIRHPKSAIALATPDRIATIDGSDRVLEIKTANLRMMGQWGAAGTDEVPLAYLAQVAWEMACADLHVADLAVLIAGDDFRVYHLRRDPDLEGMLMESAERFWRDHVVPRRPPPLDATDACARWVAERYPRERGPVITADERSENWASSYFMARANRESAEELETTARRHLEECIGDAAGIVGKDWRISWKAQADRTCVDWERVAKESGASPDLVRKYTTTKPGPRVFRPTKKEQP